MVKEDCPVHIVKHISTLRIKFPIEAVLEHGIKTVHVLIGETKGNQFM